MYEENVKRGMELLDRVMPDWLWRVDLDTLNLMNCYQCVIGQLMCIDDRYYTDALKTYCNHLEDLGVFSSALGQAEYGFGIGSAFDGTARPWKDLTATWRRMILEAREQRKLTLASQPLEAETERVLQVAN